MKLLGRITPFLIFLNLAGSIATPTLGEEQSGNPGAGHAVYERYCVSCHGDRGDGHGEAAAYEDPKPRDYRPGIFKCRSTPTGSLPLVSDLERSLENGLYGTHMPSWYPIGHRARSDAIAYVQTFSDRWRTEKTAAAMPIPAEPESSPESIRRGRQVYLQTGCANCHGDEGRGDGPAAKGGMTDVWGYAIAPADLTSAHFKCGSSSADLYRSLVTGLDGTPMASFGDSLGPPELWDIVHYLLDLGGEQSRPRSWTSAWSAFFEDPFAERSPPAPAPLGKLVITDEQILALEPVHFDPASAVVSAESFPVLDQVVRAMAERPLLRLRVEGHTDSHESSSYNLALSQQRATAVVDYLARHGADTRRLEAVGFGAARPVAPNQNPDGTDNVAGQRSNRRTEFHIVQPL